MLETKTSNLTFEKLTDELSQCVSPSHDIEITIQLLRTLRNECPNEEVKEWVSRSNVYGPLQKLFHHYASEYRQGLTERKLILLRIIVQVFGNASSGSSSEDLKSMLWSATANHISELLSGDDSKLSAYTAMFLYNCLLSGKHLNEEKLLQMRLLPNCALILEQLTLLAAQNECVFSLFFLEKLVLQENYVGLIKANFQELSVKSRIFIGDMISELIENMRTKNDFSYVEDFHSCISLISNYFLSNMPKVLLRNEMPNHKSYGEDVEEAVKFLGLLCNVSADDQTRFLVQDNAELIPNTINILKMLNSLGKSNEPNVFTPRQSLKDFSENASDSTDGFKSNIIRLVSNLVYKNQENQDKVRNLDGIAVVLDSCCLDARNPYITQWCILAIRNLCENNIENQNYISCIQNNGTVVPTPILDELNIKLAKMKV